MADTKVGAGGEGLRVCVWEGVWVWVWVRKGYTVKVYSYGMIRVIVLSSHSGPVGER